MLLPLENAVAIDATIRPEVDWSPAPPPSGNAHPPKALIHSEIPRKSPISTPDHIKPRFMKSVPNQRHPPQHHPHSLFPNQFPVQTPKSLLTAHVEHAAANFNLSGATCV